MILGDAAALILKMFVKKIQKFISGRAQQRQKYSATLVLIQFLALLNSLKPANSFLWVKICTLNKFVCVFASIPTVLETLGSMCSSK
jgi:Na+/pantothenate symporter